MTANLLNGQNVAQQLKSKLAQTISTMTQAGQRPPGLAVVLVGENPASDVYVRNKRRACTEVGIRSYAFDLPANTSEQSLLKLIDELNHNQDIDGILVQLPLPSSIDSKQILASILPSKDVDGFHPYNLGRLAQRQPALRPCTPFGIIQLLNAYELPLRGKHAVVVGASNIVGRPMALELLLVGSTVTICHRFTQQLEQHVRLADVVVVAAGQCDVVNPDWLHKEQILVDVGMHRLDDGSLRGDVNFVQAQERVAWITPVPGGVGPMTIATLLQNTLLAKQT